MENHTIIQVEDKVPFRLLIPLSIQHMFCHVRLRQCWSPSCSGSTRPSFFS